MRTTELILAGLLALLLVDPADGKDRSKPSTRAGLEHKDKALCLPVVIEGAPTVREASGLAMSSRNRYLSEAERDSAAGLYRVLCEVRDAVQGGAMDYPALEADAMARLEQAGFRPEYVSIRRAGGLAEPDAGDSRLRVLAAAWLGPARLIDNVGISIS